VIGIEQRHVHLGRAAPQLSSRNRIRGPTPPLSLRKCDGEPGDGARGQADRTPPGCADHAAQQEALSGYVARQKPTRPQARAPSRERCPETYPENRVAARKKPPPGASGRVPCCWDPRKIESSSVNAAPGRLLAQIAATSHPLAAATNTLFPVRLRILITAIEELGQDLVGWFEGSRTTTSLGGKSELLGVRTVLVRDSRSAIEGRELPGRIGISSHVVPLGCSGRGTTIPSDQIIP